MKNIKRNNNNQNKKALLDEVAKAKPIVMLLVEIGNNERKYITIYHDTHPETKAYEFCLENNLDYESLQVLTTQIKNVMESSDLGSKKVRNLSEANLLKNIGEGDNNKNFNRTNSISNSNNFNNNNNNNNINNANNNHHINTPLKPNNSNPNKPQNNQQNRCLLYASKSQLSINSQNNNNESMKKRKYINSNNNTNNNVSYENLKLECKKITNNPLLKSNSNLLNFGERLYYKGMKLKEKKEDKIEKYKTQMEIENKKKYTYRPKINKITYDQLCNRYSNKLNFDDDENILYYKDVKEQKLSDLREKYYKEEIEYNFTPTLNKRSKTMDKRRTNPKVPRYESLYSVYKKQQSDIEYLSNKIYDKNTLFKPKINNYNCTYTSITFQERQNFFISKSQEKIRKIKEESEYPIDYETGQRLFSPVINDYNRPNNNNSDIYNHLYNDSFKNDIRKKEVEQSVFNEEKYQRNNIFVNPESNDIYIKKIESSFKKIFSKLDKDEDGIISKLNVEIKSLPNNIQKIIEPIIYELKEENETLNEQEFIAACFHLFDMLNYVEKKEIINYNNIDSIKSNKNNQNNFLFTFKPQINETFSSSPTKRSSINLKQSTTTGRFSHSKRNNNSINLNYKNNFMNKSDSISQQFYKSNCSENNNLSPKNLKNENV